MMFLMLAVDLILKLFVAEINSVLLVDKSVGKNFDIISKYSFLAYTQLTVLRSFSIKQGQSIIYYFVNIRDESTSNLYLLLIVCVCVCSCFISHAVEEDWGWGLWRNLRCLGHAHQGKCCTEGGISSTTKASSENGGCCIEKTTR